MIVFITEMLNLASFVCFGAALLLVPVSIVCGAAFGAESAKERKRGRR